MGTTQRTEGVCRCLLDGRIPPGSAVRLHASQHALSASAGEAQRSRTSRWRVNHGRLLQAVATEDRRGNAGDGLRVHDRIASKQERP